MAIEQNEIKKVISVDLGNTTTSLKDYKKHIDELRGSLLQLDETSEEYKNISEEIFNEQQKLNEVMKVGKTQVDAEAGSYNALTKEMADLKKQWKATGDETKRAELGGQILDINNKLKDLDASTGNFQRNVGGYEQGFSKAMSNLKGGLTSSVPAFGKVNTAMKMIAANPIGLIITALVTAFMALKKAIAGSEDQTNRMKKAFSIFHPVANAIKNVISGIADAFVWLAEKASEAITYIMRGLKDMFEAFGWDEWAGAIQESLDAMEYANELEERNIELTKQKRENLVTEAQLRLEISELETKIADKQKYSEKERLAFLDEWEKKSRQIAQMRLDAATAEYEIIRDTNALTESSTEDKDREAEAQARMINEQRAFNEEMTTITRKRSQLLGREHSAVSKITAEREKQKQKEQQLLEEEQEMVKAIEERLEDEKKTELQKLKEKYDEEYALLVKYEKNTTALTEEYESTKAKIIASKQQEAYDEAQKARQTYYDTIKSNAEQRIFDIENDADLEIQTEQEKEKAIFEVKQNALARQMNAVSLALEEEGLTEAQREELRKQYDALDQELTNNEILRSKQVKDQEKKDAEEVAEARKAAQMATLTGAASLFGALAELSEENSKEQKAFSIMETTINGLAAVIGTFKGYSEFGFWGWAAAIAQAATITASTAATINKIKSTNKNSSGSNAAVAAPRSNTNTISMTTVSPLLNEQEDINRFDTSGVKKYSDDETQNLRVYVVDQDIRDANNRAEVVEDNATF